VPEHDYYDNTHVDEDAVEASKVVKLAAVVRQKRANGRYFLRIKVATPLGADLSPLLPEQLTAFKEYIDKIADAGTDLEVDSLVADRLKLTLTIYYNPLVLGTNGSRLDGTDNSPVPDAIRAYLQNLPFNGLFVPVNLIDALQAIEGVEIPHLTECAASFGNQPLSSVPHEYVPDSGYLRVSDADLTLHYVAHSQAN